MFLIKFLEENKKLAVKISVSFFALLVASIGFAGLAEEIREGDTLAFDEYALQSINSFSSPFWDTFFSSVTRLGGVVAVASFTAILIGYYLYKRRYYKFTLLFAGIAGAAAINQVLKAIFERARPDLWSQIVTETSFSFPSGHATASSAIAFTVVALLWYSKYRIISIILASIYVFLIGLSRLYLGVHYPTDILGGWLMSFIWVMIVAGLVYAHMRHSRRQKGADVSTEPEVTKAS